MSREFLKISSTLAEYIQEYFDNPNSDISDIQRWFNENIRGGDQLIVNRSKVSAIWLYKQLSQYKSNILDQKLVKAALDKQLKLEATQIVDYFTSQQDSEKIILLYSKYKQGYKSLKTGQEVARQVQQLRKTIKKSIAEHLKISLDIDNIKEITDAQFKQKISNKICEQKLNIIKYYLEDIGYNNTVTFSITIDKIKQDNQLKDSKLGEYIEQIYYNQEVIHEVISDTESEDTSYRTSDSSTNDRTEYNKLIKKIKHQAEEQLNQPINKVLLEINNNASQKHGLRIIKLYGISNLNIDIEVNEQATIKTASISRNRSGNKQDNHTVPVSTFLKSLEKNLKNKELTENTVKNLLHQYGKYLQDSASNPQQKRNPQHTSEFDWIKDKISSFDSKTLDQKLSIIEKYIIPFIFYEWNTRAEATFRAVKEATAYGAEGNLIKKINKQFSELIKSLKKEEIQSIDNLKEKINEILPEYCKSIDLPHENQLTSKRLGVVVSDARRLFKVWFSLLENVDENLGLRSFLDSNGSNDYKSFKEEFFNRQKFGEQIIDSKQQLTRKQKQSLKEKLSEYIASNPETVDFGSDHSEFDQSSSSGALSPRRDEDVDVIMEKAEQAPIKVEYTSDKIKLILQHYLPQKDIEQVYLIDAPDQYHNCVDNLKQQLIWETKDKVILNDKFYVVIERPDDQSHVSSVIILKLFNKNNKNQIKVLPIVGSTAGSFRDELKKNSELSAISIKVDDLPNFFLKNQPTTNVYLNNLIEVIKLSIECNAPCKVGDNDIEEIMSESSIEYEKTHKNILEQVSRVSIGVQPGTSGILKRKGIDGGDSSIKKVKFNLENLEEHRDNIGLQASGSSCPTRSPSKKRLKRDLCQEKATDEIFPYEPLEENIAEASKISARLYSQIAYLVALEHPEPTNPNIKPDNVLTYMTNIGDIISEGEINHSLREQELLQTHYQEAQDFCNTYPKDMVLDLVGAEIDLSSRAWLFDNGKHSLLVSYDGNRYHIHSPDLNYRQSFQTKKGVSFSDIELYAEAFFKWHSNSIEYDLFTLKQNVPEEITNKIKQTKFWNPDQVVSDLVLLDKGSFSNIQGIPAKVVRELFFLDGKVPELTALHENFFAQYSGKISIRVEELHNVLSSLDPQASKSLVDLAKQHNFRVDTAYLNNMPESTKSLLHSYHNEISNKLKTSESITIKDLSDLSWSVLEKEITKNPEISSELRELSLQSVKELHSVAATRAHELGITSQTLFFLPDIIRSMNTGNFEGLQKTGEMMLGDMAFNKMYDSLISKLGSVLPESRIALLKKLPITSPIFKILTIHSIIELHKQLNNLPADSEEAGIIKHQLGEQYFTIGLMVAELFGLELGPLWVGLMAEQLVYGAISLRKQYHLDISFGEAFLMNLGFEQDKLQSILTERQLVDLNLSLVDRLSAQTNTSYGLVIIKVPKMLYDAPQVGNTVIEFKPQNSRFCMEDNVFLEKNSGYKRISSVISDEQNNNCVDTAALQISGDGLAALYGNNSTEQQSIYVNFDPNEGDMKLHFTKEGLSRLDKLNNNQQNNTNVTNPYVITAKIYHKPYPDQIGLFGNTNHSFILNDDSKRVVSNYYLEGTSSFELDDNTISTSIMFFNRKISAGYIVFISGSTSNIQVRGMIPYEKHTGSIILKNKDYLNLNLQNVFIDGKLVIDIPNIEILHAQGAATLLPSHHHNTLEVSHNVLTFKILLEAPSIRQITINNKNASDVIIDTEHLANPPFTISLQGIHTQHKSYYTFEVENLQLVLDEMTFTSRHFPKYFIFLCGSSDVVKGWCKWDNNDLTKNILSIKGKINGKDEILTIEHSKATLGIFENENKCNKHIEIVNYNNVLALENSLKFEKVLKHANYNISAYYNL